MGMERASGLGPGRDTRPQRLPSRSTRARTTDPSTVVLCQKSGWTIPERDDPRTTHKLQDHSEAYFHHGRLGLAKRSGAYKSGGPCEERTYK